MEQEYVFTWAGREGPCCKRFDSASGMLCFAMGWCSSGWLVQVTGYGEIRAACP